MELYACCMGVIRIRVCSQEGRPNFVFQKVSGQRAKSKSLVQEGFHARTNHDMLFACRFLRVCVLNRKYK